MNNKNNKAGKIFIYSLLFIFAVIFILTRDFYALLLAAPLLVLLKYDNSRAASAGQVNGMSKREVARVQKIVAVTLTIGVIAVIAITFLVLSYA